MSGRYKWDFVESADRLHRWRTVRTNGDPHVSEAFVSLALAKSNALEQGFDADIDCWTVTNNGRTTHFRPGLMPINMPSGQSPPI